jgi:stage V sporulation protein G
MKITEVRIKTVAGGSGAERLRGWCTIVFDSDFVIRDVKIIEGTDGVPVTTMIEPTPALSQW